MSKEAKILSIIAGVVILGGVGLFMLTDRSEPEAVGKPTDSQSLVRETSHTVGPSDAKVTVVEFADFQCPTCAAVNPMVKKAMEAYKDKSVRFVYRYFPLRSIHKNAQISAEAGEAAGAQGKFWEMETLLYANQTEWESAIDPLPIFASFATQLGLDADKFKSEIQSGKYRDVVNADYDDAVKLNLQGTPTFFINGEKLTKVPTLDDMKTKINQALAQ